jgi:hypothetical protein
MRPSDTGQLAELAAGAHSGSQGWWPTVPELAAEMKLVPLCDCAVPRLLALRANAFYLPAMAEPEQPASSGVT